MKAFFFQGVPVFFVWSPKKGAEEEGCFNQHILNVKSIIA